MYSDSRHSNRVSIASLLVALGIIYGDIGTSPLYVFRAILGERTIDETLVFGGVSCVFWTLVFQTTIKYILLTLRADNQGEGGIFSLYALVRRYGKKLAIPAILGATTLLADGIITPPSNCNIINAFFLSEIWHAKSRRGIRTCYGYMVFDAGHIRYKANNALPKCT